MLEAAAIVFLASRLSPAFLAENWIVTLVTAGLASGRSLLGLVQTVAQKKTAVADLREDILVGRYSKDDLARLVREAVHRLGLPEDVPVYLLRDKEMNACSIHIALSPFRALRAVYLNRAVLHFLEPDELRNVLGHELGHNTRYDLTWTRYLLVHLAFASVLALNIVQAMGAAEGYSLMVVVVVLAAWEWLLTLPRRFLGQGLELLCDDLGAVLAGPVPAARELLKTGVEAEARARLLRDALRLGREGDALRVEDAVAAYEEAVPWGAVAPDTAERLAAAVRERRRRDSTPSVSGFLRYIKDDDSAQEAAEAAVKRQAMVERMPLLDRSLLAGLGPSFGEDRIADVVKQLEANPEALLFRLPDEVDDRGLSHPSFRRRLLYIWRHREAIAAEAVGLAAPSTTPIRPR